MRPVNALRMGGEAAVALLLACAIQAVLLWLIYRRGGKR